jgi:hypothetical protein
MRLHITLWMIELMTYLDQVFMPCYTMWILFTKLNVFQITIQKNHKFPRNHAQLYTSTKYPWTSLFKFQDRSRTRGIKETPLHLAIRDIGNFEYK